MSQTIDRKTLILLNAAKAIRTFGFGAVSVVFALFLQDKGFSALQIGGILSATLIKDALLTAFVSMYAGAIGMRAVLIAFSCLLASSGLVFAFCADPLLIVIASVFGILSPSGFEGGPFAALEQAIISKAVDAGRLARAFSNYNLAAFAAAALGSLTAGLLFPSAEAVKSNAAYQIIFCMYAVCGILLLVLYLCLQSKTNDVSHNSVDRRQQKRAAVSPQIWKLSFLQGLDAFGGGFIPQTLLAYWFFERYHAGPEFTGPVFFWTYLLAAVSLVLAPFVCRRFGLLKTMVGTHLPCSIALLMVPFMPSAFLAGLILIVRSLFSSMDIPARQAYGMLIVSEQERASVAGLTTAARSIGQCIAPMFSGWLFAGAWSGLPLLFAGGCKTLYDCAIYACFRKTPLHTEREIKTHAKVS